MMMMMTIGLLGKQTIGLMDFGYDWG